LKYVLFKTDDIEKYCSFEQQEQLYDMANDMARGRANDEKEEENLYYVVSLDETYANEVKEIIEKNEDVKYHSINTHYEH